MFNSFIRRPVLSIVISLVVVFLGLLALMNLPVTQFPSISPPKVNITVEYPGANNELMVKSVIIPLEQSLNGIQGLKYMTSDAGNDGANFPQDPAAPSVRLFGHQYVNATTFVAAAPWRCSARLSSGETSQ